MRFIYPLARTLKGNLVLLLYLLVLPVASLYGQSSKGTLSGQVLGVNGLPIPFVRIALEDINLVTYTDESGNYLIKAPKGAHQLTAGLMGYNPKKLYVTITGGKSTELSFGMSENPLVIREILVLGLKAKSATATKTLIEVENIPQSIAVIGQKLIQQQAAFDLTTIVRNITGITFTGNYSGAGSAQFFSARGFAMNDSQNYRLNGMMIWNWANHYADNIEQVEFLKGPASILFGDIAPGGVLNFVTKKPLPDFHLSAQLKGGSWGLARTCIDVGGPLNKKQNLRFRFNGSLEKSNSFRDYVHSAKSLIAPTLSWDISPRLSVNLETIFRASKSTDDAGLVSPDGTITGLQQLNPSLYLGEPSMEYRFKDQSHSLTATYQISKTWKMTFSAFYAKTQNRPFGLWFDQPEPNGDFVRRIYGFHQSAHNASAALDLYGTFYTGTVKHQLLVGADHQTTRFRYTNGGELSLFDTSNIYRPSNGRTFTAEPVSGPLRPYVSIIGRTGIYFQDQIMLFNEKMQLLLGIRTGTTRQGNHYFHNEVTGTPYEGYKDDMIQKAVLTPRIGLVYKLLSSASLYTSFSKGYEINSPDIFAANYLQYAAPPVTRSSQIELGSKAELLSKKWGLTLSVFRIDKRNPYGYLYLDPVNPNYDEYNVYYQGHHRSQGVELDIDGMLLPGLSVTAGGSLMQTKVMNDPGYPTGNQLPNAPKLSANVWLSYQPISQLKGLSISTGLFYKGPSYSGIINDPNLRLPKSYTWDLALGYQIGHYQVQLNATNITNQLGFLNPWQFNLFDVRPLRQLVLTLHYKLGKRQK
jgi:iron complex outermembrane receptor protein